MNILSSKRFDQYAPISYLDKNYRYVIFYYGFWLAGRTAASQSQATFEK